MRDDLEFDGWWEGIATYRCDNCGKAVRFRFDSEESAKNYRRHRRILKEDEHWLFTQVDGKWKDFCCEKCRNEYIRKNTI